MSRASHKQWEVAILILINTSASIKFRIVEIDNSVELSLVNETFCENCSHSIQKWLQPNSFGEILRGELHKDAKNSNFENFESTLYSKSGSMPLSWFETFPVVIERLNNYSQG